VFAIAIKNWGYPLGYNPMERVIKPTGKSRAIQRLHPDIVSKLQNPTIRIEWVALFALETAMRRSEIAHLRWDDIQLKEKLAHITDAKNGQSRHVPLSHQACNAIKKMDKGHAFVFGMSSNAIRLAWDKYKKKENIWGVRFHDLRHEAISTFFEKGLSVPEVALISGHKTTSQLFRYAHGDIRTLKQKLNLVNINKTLFDKK
jgi:integrase